MSGGPCDEAGMQHARTQSSRLGSGGSPASSGGWRTLPSGHGCPPARPRAVQQPSCGRVCVTHVCFIPTRPLTPPASRQLCPAPRSPAGAAAPATLPVPSHRLCPSRPSKCYKRWGLQKQGMFSQSVFKITFVIRMTVKLGNNAPPPL